jgi:hypothetical protein
MRKMKAVAALARHAACLGLVAVLVSSVAAAPGGAATTTTTTTAAQPEPTTDPSAPGIAITGIGTFDYPDPFLLNQGGKYYMYLSSAFGNNTQNVPELTGRPGHWSTKSIDAVPVLPPWAVGDAGNDELTWSPAVYKFGDLYVMYLSAQVRNTSPIQHCIGIGSSPDPAGPFYISPVPLVCQQNLGGDIDPEVFVDPHGPDGPFQPNYLVWKSDNNSSPGDGAPSIWAQPLSNDGFFLEGQPVDIFTADKSWELPLAEAPQMALPPSGSTVWMFFSAGTGFFSDHYAVGAARCAGPLGPCTDPLPGPLIASNAQGSGPGEETYFVGPDGSDWLLYSPLHTGEVQELVRPIEAARIGWNAAGPYVAQAGRFPNPTPACRGHGSQSCKRRADSGSR